MDDDIPGIGKGGRNELINSVLAVRAAFPDISPELYGLVGEEDWVALRVEAGGKHTGDPFLGVEPTHISASPPRELERTVTSARTEPRSRRWPL